MRMKREEHHTVYIELFLCIAQGGWRGPGANFFLVLDKFFQHVKKILNHGNFVSIKVAKFKLNYLG